jgi:hypothetical protein
MDCSSSSYSIDHPHGLNFPKWFFAQTRTKKADPAEHPKVFHHVGLLANEPLGTAGLPSI